MTDVDNKSKEDLTAEIAGMRSRITELENRCAQFEEMRLELLESEEKYRGIIENSLEGVYINQDDRIVFCNQQMADMFGYASPEKIAELDMQDLVSPRSRNLVNQELKQRLTVEKHVSHYKFYALRRDGTEFEVENLGSRILFHGKPAVQGVLRDISHQNQLERQLRQSQKMEAIGTLAGGIAHDFNNILSVIIGYTELILESDFKKEKTVHNLEQVLKASYRARDLVQQILSFSRQREGVIDRVEVNSIVKEVLKLLKGALPASIRIESDISNIPYVILAEATQVHQILMNLCTNASYAMKPKGGVLRVELSDLNRDLEGTEAKTPGPASYLRLSISDTGHGISTEIQDRIFDPFFTTKPVGEGTGLGLSVVHGIVKSMNGEISVQSEPGKGTSFHLFIPTINGPMMQITSPPSHHDYKGGGEHILLVDDEPELASIAGIMLEQLGFQVTSYADSQAALAGFRNEPDKFDLLITDNMMTGLTGVELALEVSKIKPEMPIILCTGFGRGINQDNIKDLGIQSLILKPYNKEEIGQAIRQCLKGTKTAG